MCKQVCVLNTLTTPCLASTMNLRVGGLPYFYVKGNYKWAELTLGDYYDQFGSGLIFRTYEERSLGIDNSLRGARLALEAY